MLSFLTSFFQPTAKPGPPLQYQSLKTVHQHMDAITRFRISRHMPSIRNVEKIVPLKIDHLEISGTGININSTTFDLRILRHWSDGNAPDGMKKYIGWGGYNSDFDVFGFPVSLGSNVLLPGDVAFQLDNDFEVGRNMEEHERRCRKELEALEKALVTVAELKSKGMGVDQHLKNLKPLPHFGSGEEYRFRQLFTFSPDFLLSCINAAKLKLIPFECRRNKTKPPFTFYIQLTIWKGGSQQIQRFEYNKKLYEAVKDLNELFFGNRTMPIRVGSFNFVSPKGIWRLPVGFRLQANKVHASDESLHHENLPLLVENSESLVSVWLHSRIERQSRILHNAKRVVIADASVLKIAKLLAAIRALSNREISIWPINHNFSHEHYFQMIEAWLNGDRPIGANFWIRMGSYEAWKTLELVRTRIDNTMCAERCVTIQRNNSTKVEVFYIREPEEKLLRRFGYYQLPTQLMKIRIVKV